MRVKRAPWLVIGLWLSTLLLALPLSLALHALIGEHLGQSMAAQAAAAGVNFDWWNEFLAQSSGVTEADALANAVHDAAVHELGHLGYVAPATAGEAQATLRSSWRVNKADDGRVSLALSVSLFDPQGHRLLTADSGTTLSVNFWNEASVHRAVEQALSRLPKAAPAASAQK